MAIHQVGRSVEVDEHALALVAPDDLNPQKARVLRLALLKPRSLGEVEAAFPGVLIGRVTAEGE